MRSVRTKMIGLVVTALILTLGFYSVLLYINIKKIIVASQEKYLLNLTISECSDMSLWLDAKKAVLSTVADTISLYGNDTSSIGTILQRHADSNPQYEIVFYADRNGDAFTASNFKTNIADRLYFQEVLRSGKAVVSDPVLSRQENHLIVVFAAPVKRGTLITGVVGCTISVDYLSQRVSAIKVMDTGYAFVVQGDGTTIIHPDRKLMSNHNIISDPQIDPALKDAVARMIHRETGLTKYRYNNVEKYVAFAPVPGINWSLAINAPVDEVLERLSPINKLIVLIPVLVILMASLLIGAFLIIFIVRPITRLRNMMSRVEEGDLDVQLDTTSRDELGQLASSFNHMVRTIKEGREKIQQSEEKYRTTLENIDEGLYEVNLDGHFEFLSNSEVFRSTGYSGEDLIKMHCREYVDPENAEKLFHVFRKVYDTGQAAKNIDFELRGKNGSKMTVETSVSLMKDTSGRPLGFRGLVRDITKRKRNEEALRESELRFKEIADLLPEAVFEVDAGLRLTFVNRKAMSLFGFTEKEIAAGYHCLDAVIPEDRKRGLEHLNKVMTGSYEGLVEYTALRRDGSTCPVIINVVAILHEGQPVGIRGIVVDITERKQAESAQRANEQMIQGILSATPVGIGLTVDGKIKWVNESWMQIFGFKAEAEYSDRPTGILYPSEEAYKEARGRIYTSLENAKVGRIEASMMRHDGAVFHAHISIAPLDPADLKKGTISAIMDISDWKKMEQSLRESEAKFRRLHESMRDGFVATDLSGRIQEMNSVYRDMLGYTETELLQMGYQDLTPEKWHDFEQKIIEHQTFKRGYADIYEKEYRRKDGSIFPVELRSYVILDKSDNPAGYWAIVRDITARNEAKRALQARENLLNKIIDILPVGLWIADKEGHILHGNPMARRIWGTEPLVGRAEYGVFKAHRLPSGEEVTPDSWALTRSINEGISVFDELLEIDTFDGKKKIIINYTAPVIGDGGEIEGAIEVNHDVSELKHMQIENLAMQNRLRNAEKMEAIGTLSGGIAHDFNNILASIMGYTELSLMAQSVTEVQDSYLTQVLKACERAKALVNQILLFSRQREGEKKPVDVKIIVKEALKLLRASLPATIKINQRIAEDDYLVLADPTHIHQIVMNLCTNAAYAMRDNGGVLAVSLTKLTASGEMEQQNPDFKRGPYLQIKIADSGCGIDTVIIDKIFDPFFTTKKHGEGTGLGLSVVYGIVKSYEGVINVESKIGQGTTFCIYLPSLTVGNYVEVEKIDQTPGRGSERILLIDDEKDLVLVMSRYLESQGYTIISSTDSAEALSVFRENPRSIDLIVTDMTMPRMTGLKLSKEILTIRPEIPIILCTGYNESITEAEAKKTGIREFVLKPVKMGQLSRLIRAVLDN